MRSLKKRGPHVLDDLNDLLFSLQVPQDSLYKSTSYLSYLTDVCICLLKIQFQNTRFCHEIAN